MYSITESLQPSMLSRFAGVSAAGACRLNPEHKARDLVSFQDRLSGADVLDHRITPAIDVHPLAVAHAILEAGHVDHVATRLRVWHCIVRLLVRDHDQAVVLFIYLTQ